LKRILAEHQAEGELSISIWHCAEECWKDESASLPASEAEVNAEHERLTQRQTAQSLAHGWPGFEVCVVCPTHRQTVRVAESLTAEGRTVLRRWRYIIVGAPNEDDAKALAHRLSEASPVDKVWWQGSELSFAKHHPFNALRMFERGN
jgi:hypothetical protein